jgi:hypothetical protein
MMPGRALGGLAALAEAAASKRTAKMAEQEFVFMRQYRLEYRSRIPASTKIPTFK